MILNPLTHIAPTIPAAAANAAFKLPTAALVARGGAAATAAVFDSGLAKTRLEGLAYSTGTTLMMSASMTLFSATPKNLESIPDDGEKAKVARFNNLLKIVFSICMSISIACGSYTTVVFTLLSIYSKTALGMGRNSQYIEFFDSCAPYRVSGFRTFLATMFMYQIGWILSLLLRIEGKKRWLIVLPAVCIGVMGFFHFRGIMNLAGAIIYS